MSTQVSIKANSYPWIPMTGAIIGLALAVFFVGGMYRSGTGTAIDVPDVTEGERLGSCPPPGYIGQCGPVGVVPKVTCVYLSGNTLGKPAGAPCS